METTSLKAYRLTSALARYLRAIDRTWLALGEGCTSRDAFDRFVDRRLIAAEDYAARKILMQSVAEMPHTALIAARWQYESAVHTENERRRWIRIGIHATDLICALLAFDDPMLVIARGTVFDDLIQIG